MKMRPTSMRGRAMTSTVLVILVFGIALGVVSYILATKVAVSSLSDIMTSQVADTRSQIVESGASSSRLPELEAVEASKPLYIQVRSSTGKVLTETPGIPPNTNVCASPAPSQGNVSEATLNLGRGPQQFLVMSSPITIDGAPANICAITSMSSVHNLQRNFIIFFLIGLPLALLGVAFSVRAALNRALGSVEDLRKQAEGMSGTQDGVLEVQQTQDEIERLGNTLNGLLGRLHDQSQATRRFIADAGHELRNPLATLRVLLEFNESKNDSYALAELNRLEGLVQDLLVLTKVDAHELNLLETFDIAPILSDTVHTHQLRHPKIGIAVDAETAAVTGDPRQMRSALDNLVSNACRHASTSVHITLTVDDGICVIAVHDDGTGLDQGDCERVFDRFVRLDEARDRDEGGSGLGLAIVAAIASSMHGSVRAQSGPGGHFYLSLPLTDM